MLINENFDVFNDIMIKAVSLLLNQFNLNYIAKKLGESSASTSALQPPIKQEASANVLVAVTAARS